PGAWSFCDTLEKGLAFGGKPFWFAVETGCGSVQLQRAGVQLVVGAVLGDQLVVGAALDDAAVVQDHDGVGVLDGGQPVSDDKGGAPGHQGVHAPLDDGLGVGVDG